MLRQDLESRLRIKMSSAHAIVSSMVEHAFDVLSKYEVGADGRTGYERMRGDSVL